MVVVAPPLLHGRVRNRDRCRNWEKRYGTTESSGRTLKSKQWRVLDFWARSPLVFIYSRRRMETELSEPCDPSAGCGYLKIGLHPCGAVEPCLFGCFSSATSCRISVHLSYQMVTVTGQKLTGGRQVFFVTPFLDQGDGT